MSVRSCVCMCVCAPGSVDAHDVHKVSEGACLNGGGSFPGLGSQLGKKRANRTFNSASCRGHTPKHTQAQLSHTLTRSHKVLHPTPPLAILSNFLFPGRLCSCLALFNMIVHYQRPWIQSLPSLTDHYSPVIIPFHPSAPAHHHPTPPGRTL